MMGGAGETFSQHPAPYCTRAMLRQVYVVYKGQGRKQRAGPTQRVGTSTSFHRLRQLDGTSRRPAQ
jgi:hypothetical protein